MAKYRVKTRKPHHPTAEWAAQQIVEAFPFDEKPRYVLRDRDQI